MLYYLRYVWEYLKAVWRRQPPLVERIPDNESDDSRQSVLIYEDSSEEDTESVVQSRA